jgi:hypothetical protein
MLLYRTPHATAAFAAARSSCGSTQPTTQGSSKEREQVERFEYLAAVLRRVADHTNARIDELLPAKWAATRA